MRFINELEVEEYIKKRDDINETYRKQIEEVRNENELTENQKNQKVDLLQNEKTEKLIDLEKRFEKAKKNKIDKIACFIMSLIFIPFGLVMSIATIGTMKDKYGVKSYEFWKCNELWAILIIILPWIEFALIILSAIL